MQILGHKNVRKMQKIQKLLMSDSIRHNGQRKRPAFNAGEIDEDKRDLGIAGHRYPEGEAMQTQGTRA